MKGKSWLLAVHGKAHCKRRPFRLHKTANGRAKGYLLNAKR